MHEKWDRHEDGTSIKAVLKIPEAETRNKGAIKAIEAHQA